MRDESSLGQVQGRQFQDLADLQVLQHVSFVKRPDLPAAARDMHHQTLPGQLAEEQPQDPTANSQALGPDIFAEEVCLSLQTESDHIQHHLLADSLSPIRLDNGRPRCAVGHCCAIGFQLGPLAAGLDAAGLDAAGLDAAGLVDLDVGQRFGPSQPTVGVFYQNASANEYLDGAIDGGAAAAVVPSQLEGIESEGQGGVGGDASRQVVGNPIAESLRGVHWAGHPIVFASVQRGLCPRGLVDFSRLAQESVARFKEIEQKQSVFPSNEMLEAFRYGKNQQAPPG